MNYDLAKQLKDAGYSQTKKKGVYVWKKLGRVREISEGGESFETLMNDEDTVYIPPLSELIEECGEKFVLHGPFSCDVNEYYYQHPNIWTAYHQGIKDEEVTGTGSTPEEAVAKLWLALNKK